jgi:hypothetical protein
MALHLTLKNGQSFEVKSGDKKLKVSVNRLNGSNFRVSLEGPRDFLITNLSKSKEIAPGIRKKIPDETG